jgi:hypothetical protein
MEPSPLITQNLALKADRKNVIISSFTIFAAGVALYQYFVIFPMITAFTLIFIVIGSFCLVSGVSGVFGGLKYSPLLIKMSIYCLILLKVITILVTIGSFVGVVLILTNKYDCHDFSSECHLNQRYKYIVVIIICGTMAGGIFSFYYLRVVSSMALKFLNSMRAAAIRNEGSRY